MPVLVNPTAVHADRSTHETEYKSLRSVVALGLGTILQRRPFQSSMNVRSNVGEICPPTAAQNERPTQSTPARKSDALVVGAATIDQSLPTAPAGALEGDAAGNRAGQECGNGTDTNEPSADRHGDLLFQQQHHPFALCTQPLQTAGMLNDADLVAFVATTDIAKARAFYADVVGLTLTEDSPFACVFDANGTSVRVTPVRDHTPAPFTVLGWIVADIAASIRDLASRGAAFQRFDGIEQDDLGIWTTPDGSFVAWFKDPDGNLLSLTRHASE